LQSIPDIIFSMMYFLCRIDYLNQIDTDYHIATIKYNKHSKKFRGVGRILEP